MIYIQMDVVQLINKALSDDDIGTILGAAMRKLVAILSSGV